MISFPLQLVPCISVDSFVQLFRTKPHQPKLSLLLNEIIWRQVWYLVSWSGCKSSNPSHPHHPYPHPILVMLHPIFLIQGAQGKVVPKHLHLRSFGGTIEHLFQNLKIDLKELRRPDCGENCPQVVGGWHIRHYFFLVLTLLESLSSFRSALEIFSSVGGQRSQDHTSVPQIEWTIMWVPLVVR